MSAWGQAGNDGTPRLGTRLDVRNAACRRGGRLLFSALSFSLTPGQAAIVRGPNGVGKSSLLRMLCGLLPTFAGEIAATGSFALADDRLALDADRPLGAALAFWARIDGGTARLADAMETFALAPLTDVPVRMLSTGQRKRAGIARVLASGATIWLLDEPANGLDTASLALLGGAVDRHLGEGGIVVAASHQPLPWASALDLTLAPPDAAEEDDA